MEINEQKIKERREFFSMAAGLTLIGAGAMPVGTASASNTNLLNAHIFETVSDLMQAPLSAGDFAIVKELFGAPFFVESVAAISSGDFSLSNGLKAVLQSHMGGFDIKWFGAITNGTDQIDKFNLAANRAGINQKIYITPGSYRLDSQVSHRTNWEILPGGWIDGLANVLPSNSNDTSFLKGTVIDWNTTGPWNTLRIGDPKYTVEKAINKSLSSEIEGHSDNAAGGVLGTTYSSARTNIDSSRVGVQAVALNNDSSDSGVWGAYIETYHQEGSNGNAFCLESTAFNSNPDIDVEDTPNRTVVGRQGLTYNLWLTTGGDSAYGQTMYNSTAAIGILGKEGQWGAKFEKGIIFKNNSVESKEALSMPQNYQLAWYKDACCGDKKRAYIDAVAPLSDGQITLATYDSSNDKFQGLIITPSQISGSDGQFNCGAINRRFKTVYSVNGAISTSDKREKEQVREVNEVENEVAKELKKKRVMYKWRNSVKEKGSKARWHCGWVAQEVIETFKDYGLDPFEYGIVCYEEWDDITDESGEIIQKSGDRYSLRIDELLTFIIGAL